MKRLLGKDFLKTAFFALFVSVVLLFVVFEIKKFQGEEEVKEVKNRVLNLNFDHVNKIKVSGYIFIRDRDLKVWRAVSPVTDYLNFRAVEDWLAAALSFDGRRLSDKDEHVRWTDFGFLKNSPEITYYDNKNAYSLRLSNKNAFDGSSYIKYKKNNESGFLFSSDPEWARIFEKKPKDFRSLKVFDWTVPEPSSKVKVLKIKVKNKEKLSFYKESEIWKSEKDPKWTLNTVKIESFLNDLQQQTHKGFADSKMRLQNPEVSLFVSNQKKSGFSINIYEEDKKVYGVASYRPEHIFELDKKAVDEFSPNPIEFRESSDLIKDFDVDLVKAVKIRKDSDNQVFRFKDDLWVKTDGEKIAAGFEFNGAKVFSLLEDFKKIQYKRYVKDREVIFKSAKKKLYFYKDQKNIEYTYSVGQRYPCTIKSRGYMKCVLVATNKVQGYYGVALRQDVEKIFKYGFIQKIPKPEPEKEKAKENKNEEIKIEPDKKSDKQTDKKSETR